MLEMKKEIAEVKAVKSQIFAVMALFFGMFAFISIDLNFTKSIFSYTESSTVNGYLLIVCFFIAQVIFFFSIYWFLLKPFLENKTNNDVKNNTNSDPESKTNSDVKNANIPESSGVAIIAKPSRMAKIFKSFIIAIIPKTFRMAIIFKSFIIAIVLILAVFIGYLL